MDTRELTYEQLPQPIPRNKYKQARNEIIETYQELSGVVALYDTGTVADPGISDLDIKVIYDPTQQPEAPTNQSYSEIVETLVGRGNIIKVPLSAFEKFHYLDPLRDPSNIYGEEVTFETPPESDHELRDAAYVLDYIPERLYQVLRLEQQESIPVMRTLQMLKSVGYSCIIMDNLLDEFDGQSFADEVDQLRGGWFERKEADNFDRMHELIDKAKEKLIEAAKLWFDQTPPRIIENDQSTHSAISLFDELIYISGDKFDYERGSEFDVKMTIPSWWFDHYRFYATRQNTLAEWLQIGYVDSGASIDCLTPEYKRYLATKFEICNDAFSWSVKNDVESSLKFGYLLHRTDWDTKQKRDLQSRVTTEHIN